MDDEMIEELTPEECDLFRRAEAEALAGMTVDFEAGLAIVRARARDQTPPPAVPRQRSGSSSGTRLRVVAGLVVLAAFGAIIGHPLVTTGAGDGSTEPPGLSAPLTQPSPAGSPATSLPTVPAGASATAAGEEPVQLPARGPLATDPGGRGIPSAPLSPGARPAPARPGVPTGPGVPTRPGVPAGPGVPTGPGVPPALACPPGLECRPLLSRRRR
jgi:hypothetical protein